MPRKPVETFAVGDCVEVVSPTSEFDGWYGFVAAVAGTAGVAVVFDTFYADTPLPFRPRELKKIPDPDAPDPQFDNDPIINYISR